MGCKLKISYFIYLFSLFSNLSLSLVLLTFKLSLSSLFLSLFFLFLSLSSLTYLSAQSFTLSDSLSLFSGWLQIDAKLLWSLLVMVRHFQQWWLILIFLFWQWWWFFVFSIWWCFSGSGDRWVLVVWLSFNRWLLAVVGLLDLVVVAGCVGLIYGGRESEIGEMREIFFFFWVI